MWTAIITALGSLFDLIKAWFGREAKRQKTKEEAIDKTTTGIGKGKPFIVLLLLLLISGCGYVYTVSTPMTFDPNDFQYVKQGQRYEVPQDGYYFSNPAMEAYIRAKIAEYEMRKRGFFHKEE